MVALGAEVICSFEGKGRLCPRLPLVGAHRVLGMGELQGGQSRGRDDL